MHFPSKVNSALFYLYSGLSDCVMVVGFEKMEKGSLGLKVLN